MSKARAKVAYVTLPWELLSAEIRAEFSPNNLYFPVLFFSWDNTHAQVGRCSQTQNTPQPGSSDLL